MNSVPRQIPIYNSKGDPSVIMVFPYLYNLLGEWIGWVTPEREVYSLLGVYVGYLANNDTRILRKRCVDWVNAKRPVPPAPPRLQVMPTIPLAPMMPELMYETMDVLLEQPELLHTPDMGELREDMD